MRPNVPRLHARVWVVAILSLLVSAPVQTALAAAPTAASPPTMSNCPNGMISADDLTFRVWACNDGPGATIDVGAAINLIQHLYGPMIGYVGTPPLPDIGGVAGGGDSRIDIYLIGSGQSLTREGNTHSLGTNLGLAPWDAVNGTTSSGYILVSRVQLDSNAVDFNSTLAHEFFHVLSFARNTTISCGNYWFLEAAATWAEWYFAPNAAADMVYPYFITDFQPDPTVNLFDSAKRRPYGDFIWPLFMQQTAGAASIANAWKAMVNQTGCLALNTAVDAQVPFVTNFGHFAVRNFDTPIPDFITHQSPAWPTNFGPTYQDPGLVPFSGSAPPFPQVQPESTTITIMPSANYPWTATTKISLPPLSARYDLYELGAGASVEFDFTKLSNPGDLDINLIGADAGSSGGAHILLPISHSDARVCVIADGAQSSEFHVVLDNHSALTPATIAGSYSVRVRQSCATGLHGTLSVIATIRSGPAKTTVDQTLKVKLTDSLQGWTLATGSAYDARYKSTSPDCGGTLTTAGTSAGPMRFGDVFLGAYSEPYSVAPLLFTPFLGTESAPATYSSPCRNGTTVVSLSAGTQCPSTAAGVLGGYSAGDGGVFFSCSDQYSLGGMIFTNVISGTLVATNPMPCGLWTPGQASCVIGAAK